jgi:diketogulonate reductase-like aldo/keto reductase
LRVTKLPSGEAVPILGQGTWHLAEDPASRSDEIAALRLGLDLGMTLIDTAEMYGDGGSEKLVGEAIDGRRDEVFLVSKVLPSHATRNGTIRACKQSLRRLGTDRLDLYLLHWRESVPLSETVDGFRELIADGMIRYWGVSNFDVDDMTELFGVAGGAEAATDQVLYNLKRRGIEYDLLPWCRNRSIPIMAYSPIEQGKLLRHPTVTAVAKRHGVTPAQVALAWVLRSDDVIAIPKAATTEHIRQNREALDFRLSALDLAALDTAFPPPTRKKALEVI